MDTLATPVVDFALSAQQLVRASDEREQLILNHLPQVKLIARRIHERLPDSIPLDDLISAGTVGLITAIDRFDPKQNVQIRTYAEYKIRGAILDSLRGLDWASRQQRRRGRLIEQAVNALEQQHQRAAEEDEIADGLGLGITEYQTWLSDSQPPTVKSIDGSGDDGERGNLLRCLADSSEKLPLKILERAEMESCLARGIEALPEVERTVLSLYFFEELNLREIGAILTLTQSRISQLKTQAVLRLRAYLKKTLIGKAKRDV